MGHSNFENMFQFAVVLYTTSRLRETNVQEGVLKKKRTNKPTPS